MSVSEWARAAWGDSPPPLTPEQRKAVDLFGSVKVAGIEREEIAA